ncbi:MAG: response regulator transcription factor [Pseudanabaenales cyanobacterium]|nr:response regulator transcription factor [Pseudanabaenales cyanobacterium]
MTASVASSALLRGHISEDSQGRRPYSVLLADGNPDFRQGLRSLLAFYNHHSPAKYVVVGEAASGPQTLHLTASMHPGLVILNVDLEDSWEATVDILIQLQELERAPSILLLSDQHEPESLFEGMRAGALGYITKDHIATELLTAIQTIAAGQIYLNSTMVNTFFYLFHAHSKQSLEKCKLLRLSKREQELLRLLARGESNEAIAKELIISIATVKSHFTSIFEKLGVKSRTQAIIRALRLGLV